MTDPYFFLFVVSGQVLLLFHFFLTNKYGHRNVLYKRQMWMSIFHINNFKKKTNPGLLFLLKVQSCVFISNFHHSPPPPPKGYKIVSLIIN